MPRERRPDRIWDPMGYPLAVLRRSIETEVSSLRLPAGARVLDFGCGSQPYRSLLGTEIDYLGADLPGNAQADIDIIDGVVDLPDTSVDLVFSTQVLEHVSDPATYLAECRRVLRPGGHLLLTTHGVMFYHPHPTDFWRWTADGLSSVVTAARLSPTSIQPLVGAVPLGLWLVMMNVQNRLPRGIRHAVVSLLNLAIRWTDRFEWDAFRADFVYVVAAEREPADD